MAKKTIKKRVEESAADLRGMDRAQLRQWAILHGLDTSSGFTRFKAALRELKILDWEADRADQARNVSPNATHRVTLFSDARHSHDRFAITDRSGKPLWFGRFFETVENQAMAELEAAKKSIWLSGQIREAIGAAVIRLDLKVDAKWLTTRRGKAAVLNSLAGRAAVDLRIQWIPGVSNPADPFTVGAGYKKWSDNDLAALGEEIGEHGVAEDEAEDQAA